MTIQRKLAIAFLVCCLVAGKATLLKPRVMQLTLEMSSSTDSLAQLFYDVGRGINEGDSRTAKVSATDSQAFQTLTFELPNETIRVLRFDPLTTAGRFTIRNVQIISANDVLQRIPDSDIREFNQIASHVRLADGIEFSTAPEANDAGLLLELHGPLRLRGRVTRQNVLVFARTSAMLLVLFGIAYWLLSKPGVNAVLASADERAKVLAGRLSSDVFLPFDSTAIWFFISCLFLFLLAVLFSLNGSSIGMYSASGGHGARAAIWAGAPRAIRSDEWAYETPDVLNEALRADRFATRTSPLGAHSAALLGNVPVRHFSTFFRPQFWPFFVLPAGQAFAFYWQSKALLLMTGTFTWLLLLTRSSWWSITGALWFFFSPVTQWTYSWPSALPEMIGSACLGWVFFCYLALGRSKTGLLSASAGAVICWVNFAFCFYLPHMVPVFWVTTVVSLAWCFAQRRHIVDRHLRAQRSLAVGLSIAAIGAVGTMVYVELRPALSAIAETRYPGQRVLSGGQMRLSELGSHFMPWTESEAHFPDTLGNICEGSGFLWLAPMTLLCWRRAAMSRVQVFALAALWLVLVGLLAWFVLPIPTNIGRLAGLDRVPAARGIPALGLANIAIVVLTVSGMRAPAFKSRIISGVVAAAIFGLLLGMLRSTNAHLGGFFSSKEILFAAIFTSALAFLIMDAKKLLLSLALIVPVAVAFGGVNPIERGIGVITSSQLYAFVHADPALLQGTWMIFSDSPVSSGFFAAVGCETYTGTRYLPDIDHFALLARRGLDVGTFNRLGYLDAHAVTPMTATTVALNSPVVVQWNIAPSDPLLKTVGIRYVAFDQAPAAELTEKLRPLAVKPVDGFWLYQLP